MKLLFFIHSLSGGGAERVTATLANHWAQQGWEVVVATTAAEDQDFYALDGRIKRIAQRLNADSGGILRALWNNYRRVRAMRTVLRRERPDVAIAMMTTANCLLALASRGMPGIAIGSERIHPPANRIGRHWEMIRRWTYPRLDGLVAQTAQSADWLRNHAPAPRIEIIPNPVKYPVAIHEPRVSPVALQQELGRTRMLLAVGRLDRQKGFDRLINGFAAVCPNCPEWSLVILGEGSLRGELEYQVEMLDLQDCIRLPGAVGNMREWYETADLYALTSRFEGFPNTLVEALAHGVPAIAVDCETGPRDILRHEVDGLLIPQDDQDALVDGLDHLMNNGEKRTAYAARAVEARERFAVDRVAGQWEIFFNELVQNR